MWGCSYGRNAFKFVKTQAPSDEGADLSLQFTVILTKQKS